jgi:uncharacterized protein YwqG
MATSSKFQVGQRWQYREPIDEFEPTFVIGAVEEAGGKKDYCIYVRYSAAAAKGVRKNMDGIVLILSEADLSRNAVNLIESGVTLPEWWVYGRMPGKRAPTSMVRYSADKITATLDALVAQFRTAAEGRSARASAVKQSEVLRQLGPWREANRRPAWKPVVEKGDGGLAASKFSGIPFLSADESWPTCSACDEPLQLFLQLDLAALPAELKDQFGKGLLQLFYCIHDCAAEKWAPFSEGKLVRIVRPTRRTGAPDVPIKKGYFPAKTITGWSAFDDYPSPQEHDELGLKIDFDFTKNVARVQCAALALDFDNQALSIPEAISMASKGDKLAGWPHWIQSAEYPDCPKCGSRMHHVFQIDSRKNLPFMFGDVGCGHITQCPTHKDIVTFAWACS